MRCVACGGLVEWQGPLTNLTHTKCLSCGRINNQEVEYCTAEEEEEIDNATQQTQPNICKHCGMDIRVRNPSGHCDHLYYPDNCDVCKRQASA